MTVWYHLTNLFTRRRALQIAGLVLVCVALITTLLLANAAQAAPNTTKTVNFQGRLTSATGAVVADGYYNMQFKIYQDGAGTAVNNPGGTLKWTENHTNNGGLQGVKVRNGFFSVDLGSVTPFGTSVDWEQNTLWLSMNIAGNNPTCPTFGTDPCIADGEMLPMKRITATPYSINSGAVGGKTADDLVQLGQGTQTDDSTNSSIAINKTGAGDLVQLQASGKDAFTVNNAGSVTLGSATDQSITVASADTGAGKALTVSAGGSAAGSELAGGDLVLQGGAGDGAATSGDVIVKANNTNSTGTFQVQDAAGTSILTVDTANKVVSTGGLSLISSDTGGVSDTVSLWGGGAVVGTAYNDGMPIVLGTIFKASTPGVVTGVRYYSPTGGTATGNNIGQLWSCVDASCSPVGAGGTVLGTVTFAADETEGWKTAQFATPIPISANTYYQVTYTAATGTYYAAGHYFDNEYTRGILSAPSGDTVSNGRFNDQNNGLFPNSSFNNTNYWADVTFQPDTGVDQIHSDNGLIVSSNGNMTVGPTSSTLKLQGSAIDIGAKNGGNVTMQGGDATVSDGNGGSVYLSGGAGSGTGAEGLVVLSTPTFSTTASDANCYTGGAPVASSCTITMASVNGSSAILTGFSATGQTATLPDPTITTAGRIMYVMAASGSQDFTLSVNGGGMGNETTMRQNTVTTMIWNGSDWITGGGGGGTSSSTLQGAYDNTPQNAGSADIVVDSSKGSLVVRNSESDPISGTILEVKNATNNTLLSVNSPDTTAYASDGTVSDGVNFTTNWPSVAGASVTRNTTDGQEGNDSVEIASGTTAFSGVRNKLTSGLDLNTRYRVTVYAKLVTAATLTDYELHYSPDNGTTSVSCIDYVITPNATTGWSKITCNIDTVGTAVSDPYVYFIQPTATGSDQTYLLDNLSLVAASTINPNVKVGGTEGSDTTLFTVDKGTAAPTTGDHDALLGSMYYDTTLGKLQCYEAAGWGACDASPDTFVTLSPEYTNAVTHGAGIGTLSSDLCSDTLNINDGSSAQPTVCGTNETYNFYNWTSPEATAQERSFFVTYQLPTNFKEFVPELTSVMGRTDNASSSVTYQIYRNDRSASLAACGSPVSVSSGSQTAWQKAAATGSADPSACGFAAGDSIVIRINMTTSNNANAYISDLGFTFSTQ